MIVNFAHRFGGDEPDGGAAELRGGTATSRSRWAPRPRSTNRPLSGGRTVVGQRGDVDIQQARASLINVRSGASLAEVVKALNAVGANPMDHDQHSPGV